jgi:hypothetical protein
METKMKKCLFDIELAKKIMAGDMEGRIVTRTGIGVRIICFDKIPVDKYPIVALVKGNRNENPYVYNSKGYTNFDGVETSVDLFIEVPEYLTFKPGDIITCGFEASNGIYCVWCGIMNSIAFNGSNFEVDNIAEIVLKSSNGSSGCVQYSSSSYSATWVRRSTDEEVKVLVDGLKKDSTNKEAITLLKKYFNIDLGPKYNFKTFDKVVCRNSKLEWYADFFSHIRGKDYQCIGGLWAECLPYNEKTALLIGKTDNWEEKI